MVILTPQKEIFVFRGRGRLGFTKADRLGLRTYAEALATNPFAGVYQRKITRKGKKTSQMNWRYGGNPRTPAQQAWRAFFTAGVSAYHSLTTAQKLYYKKVGAKYKMTGYNKFLSYWLKNQIAL